MAFYTEENVSMTASFLERLCDEKFVQATIYLNGGSNDWRGLGDAMLVRMADWDDRLRVIPAYGWPFYRMWNEGIAWAARSRADVCLVLNNDIDWSPGALGDIGETLRGLPIDVGAVYPGPEEGRGLNGWCFAVRPDAFIEAGPIDEGYGVWYGDNELVRLLARVGYRTQMVDLPVTHRGSKTLHHRPGWFAEAEKDRARFAGRWGG